jgi:hypothetical protein
VETDRHHPEDVFWQLVIAIVAGLIVALIV